MQILIVKLSAIGDVTHTLPALTTLRRHQPDARITWLVEEPGAEIVRGHPALDRVLLWRRRDCVRWLKSGRWLRAAGLLRDSVRELRDTRYDLVLDFQAALKSAWWVALARAPRKAGYGRGLRHDEWSWLALNERVSPAQPGAHAIERSLHLLECLGFPRLPLRYDFPILPENDAEAERLLAGAGLAPGAPYVAINPVTRWPTKNWAPEHFAAVADGLAAAGLPSLLTGAAGDRGAVDAICAAMRSPARRLDGRTSLKTLAAVFRRARALLSTDTGPMHIAVAVGRPVVALFGPTSPTYTGPYGEGHIVLRAGVECSPCFKRVCKTTRYEKLACMLRLSPEHAIQAVLRLAGAGVARPRLAQPSSA